MTDDGAYQDMGPGSDDRDLAAFVDDLREVYSVAPDEAIRDRHLARMHEAAGPAPAAAARSRTRTPTWRPLRSIAVRAGTAAVAAVVATGGLAAAGALPGPVQDAVAKVASKIGLDLPRSDEREAERDDRRGEVPKPSAEASPSPTILDGGDNSGPGGGGNSGPGGGDDRGNSGPGGGGNRDDNSGPGGGDGRDDNSGPGGGGGGQDDNSGPGGGGGGSDDDNSGPGSTDESGSSGSGSGGDSSGSGSG